MIVIGGNSRISDLRWLLVQVIALEEFFEVFVAAYRHEAQLKIRPCVKLSASHEGYLRAEATMNGSTIKTDENAVVDASPIWIRCSAVEALLICRLLSL